MRPTIPQPTALLVFALSISACGGPDLGVDVEIVIEKELKSDIRVKAKSVQQPGTKNPIEISVTFENGGEHSFCPHQWSLGITGDRPGDRPLERPGRGPASGRFYIGFEGRADNIQDSYVAGVFEDAPIVYYGNPGH